MEALLLVVDCIGLVLLMYWTARNEDRGDRPVAGLFRYQESPVRNAGAAPDDRPRRSGQKPPPSSARR